MKNFFKKIFNPENELLIKITYLCVSVFCLGMSIAMLFIPFFAFKSPASLGSYYTNLTPISAFTLPIEATIKISNLSTFSIGLFIFVMCYIGLSLLISSVCVVSFFRKNLRLLGKFTLVSVIITTCGYLIYFISSVAISAASRINGTDIHSANNFIPLIIMVFISLVFSIAHGLNNKIKTDKIIEKSKKRPELVIARKKLIVSKFILFFFTLAIGALAIVTILTNILHVVTLFNGNTINTLSISGIDFLTNYASLPEGERSITFIIFTMLSIIITALFLALVAFVSRSKTFPKIAMTSIIIGAVCALLVGLYGKYYQLILGVNQTVISDLLLSFGINPQTSLAYQVRSNSFFYFMGCVAILALFVVLKPFTKISINEQKFQDAMNSFASGEVDATIIDEVDTNIKGEISISDVPDELLAGNGQGVAPDGSKRVYYEDPCPTFTEEDEKIPEYEEELNKLKQSTFENPSLPALVDFIVNYARNCRLHLSYTHESIATFLAGLGTTKLSILQGMSGTGKTSLPKIVAEALSSRCDIIEVESSWRDKNELLGYYNEFSKTFTPKKFTQALYRARLNPDILTFIVLDEMNLSRIEYYFSDFLSLMENEPDKREIKLVNVKLRRTVKGKKIDYKGLTDGHNIKIPPNVWFIGTANRDESTFEISDKVYDRAYTINFNKRAPKVMHYGEPIDQRYMPIDVLDDLFTQAKNSMKFNIDEYPVIAKVEKLLTPYNISFGNRIAKQIEDFVAIYCSCFSANDDIIHTAVETILLSKVVSKLELKSVEDKAHLAREFEKLSLTKCSEFIQKLNED